MLGRSLLFLGITSYFFLFFYFFFFLGGGGGGGGGGKYVLLNDTTRRPEWGSNPRPLDPESEVKRNMYLMSIKHFDFLSRIMRN